MNRLRPLPLFSRRTAVSRQGETAVRRFARRLARYAATLVALLILFYATSLHGLGVRTLILAAILIGCLYWIFQDVL